MPQGQLDGPLELVLDGQKILRLSRIVLLDGCNGSLQPRVSFSPCLLHSRLTSGPTQGNLGTVIKRVGSVVIVPLQWIVQGKLPAAGANVCAGAMRRSDDQVQQSFDSGAPLSLPQAP